MSPCARAAPPIAGPSPSPSPLPPAAHSKLGPPPNHPGPPPQDARVIYEVKGWLAAQGSKVKVLAKVESAASVEALDDILDAADGGGGGLGGKDWGRGGGKKK